MNPALAPRPRPGVEAADDGLGVYIHWPFCLSKCPYCDFNSHVRARIDERRWRAALLGELDYFAGLAPGRRVTSVFFGGGTPSLMTPKTVAALIDRVAGHWPIDAQVEITLEANPTSVEAGRFAGYRAAGVNRVSLGVQSFRDDALRFLGRGHSAAEAGAAIDVARAHFPRISFDLIYALPDQTVPAWRTELGEALTRAADHLSLYQLTLEPGTAFHQKASHGALTVPDADHAAALYDATQEACGVAGLPAYEISNHAAPGAESRHNLNYWRAGEYVGVGPGAHGRLALDGASRGEVVATRQIRAPERWLATVEGAGHATRERVTIGGTERVAEVLMMGLRVAEGVARARFEARTGQSLEAALPPDRLNPLVEDGFLELDAAGLRATPRGRRLLDRVLAALLP